MNSTQTPSPVSFAEVLQQLGTSTQGLSQTEAKNRLTQYGYNELAEKKVSTPNH